MSELCFKSFGIRVKILILSLMCFSIGIFASEEPCPKKIDTKQSIVKNVSGWNVFQDPNNLHILRIVDFYTGNPKKMALLAPDNEDSLHDPVWTFAANDEIWQVCRYTNTKISLTRKLGAGLKSCAVKYNKQVSSRIDSITCS